MTRFHPLRPTQRTLLVAFFVAWLLTIAQTARCAENSATITGRVMSSAGDFLEGASIRVWVQRLGNGAHGVHQRPPTKEIFSAGDGRYSLTLPLEGMAAQEAWVEVSKPGFQHVNDYSRFQLTSSLPLHAGKETAASFILQPGFYVTGTVVDSGGKPVADAVILAGWMEKNGSLYDLVHTGSDGRFKVFRMPPDPAEKDERGTIRVEHPGLLHVQVANVYRMTPAERTSLRIVMQSGHVLEGIVTDDQGRPLAGALIEALFADRRLRQAARSGTNGHFRLTGLPNAAATLRAHADHWHAKGKMELKIDGDRLDLKLVLHNVSHPKALVTHDLLGITVVNNSPELAEFYELPNESGVVVLGRAAGSPFDARIGEGAWLDCAGSMVQTARGLRELLAQIIREIERNSDRIPGNLQCTILFFACSVDQDDVTGGSLMLSEDQFRKLRELLAQLQGK